MSKIPDPTKSSLDQRLAAHPRDRWLQIHDFAMWFWGPCAYLDAQLIQDGKPVVQKLCRQRYGCSAHI